MDVVRALTTGKSLYIMYFKWAFDIYVFFFFVFYSDTPEIIFNNNYNISVLSNCINFFVPVCISVNT